MVSMPDGTCSKERPLSSKACSTLRPKPISEFILSFSMFTEQKPFLPAMPVITKRDFWQVLPTIQVPSSSGALVLRMLMGMPCWRTGKMASSWSTGTPMYASSLSSLYVITSMASGLSMIRGSAIRKPDTSVQFSYTSALMALATIEPVISDPPLEKVLILPSGIEP